MVSPSHRAVNPSLAGGALLDIGVYSITWLLHIFGLPSRDTHGAPLMTSVLNKYEPTQVDDSVVVVLHYPGLNATGVATASLRRQSRTTDDNIGVSSVCVQGSTGEIHLMGPSYRPKQIRIVLQDGRVETENFDIPRDSVRQWGHGMFWEADECARCVRDEKLESVLMSLNETLATMDIMEKVLIDGGVRYPDSISSDSWKDSE